MAIKIHVGRRDDLLHTISPPTRPDEGQSLARMACWTAIRPDHAASSRYSGGQIHLAIRPSKTFHADRHIDRMPLAICPRVDIRNRIYIRYKQGEERIMHDSVGSDVDIWH